MNPPRNIWIIVVVLTFAISCTGKTSNDNSQIPKKTISGNAEDDSLKLLLKQNIDFIGDSILFGNKHVIENYINKYQIDTCPIIGYSDAELKENVEGVKVVDGIIEKGKHDTIFIVPSFSYCENGQSYCFFNNSIPRLYTESNCCHLSNFFTVGDVDEDGVLEIGIYFSSCVSRYKSLRVYSLKNEKWVQIGLSSFDIDTKDPANVSFKNLVKKVKKNEFKMCSFMDGITEWKTTIMK
jgi:hypothetical protein